MNDFSLAAKILSPETLKRIAKAHGNAFVIVLPDEALKKLMAGDPYELDIHGAKYRVIVLIPQTRLEKERQKDDGKQNPKTKGQE